MCHVCGEEGGVWETKNVSACVTLCLFNVFVFLLVNAMIWTGITGEGVISGPLVVKNRIVNVKISFKQVSQTLLFAILPHCLPVYDHFFISFLAWKVFFFCGNWIFNFMLQLRYIVWQCSIFPFYWQPSRCYWFEYFYKQFMNCELFNLFTFYLVI